MPLAAVPGVVSKDLGQYVRNDLQRLDCPPSQLLVGATETGDPLESVLYLTSVGVPSTVYGTVLSLRQARGARLGATQRKLPEAHFAVLAGLGVLELSIFPVLAAGCSGLYAPFTAELPGGILLHAALFGVMTATVVLTFLVLADLWSPTGETYNVRAVLSEMVAGLEEELEMRLAQPLEEASEGLDARQEEGQQATI